jgi:hypothetical protein
MTFPETQHQALPVNPSARVVAAIEHTRKALPGYFERTLFQRASLSPEHCGSTVHGTPAEVEALLLEAAWAPYEHSAVAPGCVAFRAHLPGPLRVGVVELARLDGALPVKLADVKSTGYYEVEIEAVHVSGTPAEYTDFVTAILGDHEGGEVVFTFHPGEPIAPSRVAVSTPGLPSDAMIPVHEARRLGFTYAKVR